MKCKLGTIILPAALLETSRKKGGEQSQQEFWGFSLFCKKRPPVQMNTMIKYARQASLWKWEIKAEGSQEHMRKAGLPLLPQLLCTLGSILLTSHISIRLQHIPPSPATNPNLEGSDLPAQKPFDKLVTDARQRRAGGERVYNAIANLCRHPRKLRGLLGSVWEGEGAEMLLICFTTEDEGRGGQSAPASPGADGESCLGLS